MIIFCVGARAYVGVFFFVLSTQRSASYEILHSAPFLPEWVSSKRGLVFEDEPFLDFVLVFMLNFVFRRIDSKGFNAKTNSCMRVHLQAGA